MQHSAADSGVKNIANIRRRYESIGVQFAQLDTNSYQGPNHRPEQIKVRRTGVGLRGCSTEAVAAMNIERSRATASSRRPQFHGHGQTFWSSNPPLLCRHRPAPSTDIVRNLRDSPADQKKHSAAPKGAGTGEKTHPPGHQPQIWGVEPRLKCRNHVVLRQVSRTNYNFVLRRPPATAYIDDRFFPRLDLPLLESGAQQLVT